MDKNSLPATISNHIVLNYISFLEVCSKDKQSIPLPPSQPSSTNLFNTRAAASLYEPLVPNEIRLIVLHRRVDGVEDVHCSLITRPLDNAPPYIALSYVWGSQAATASIIIDELEFVVTQNLKDALLRLRSSEQEEFIWADALAINQLDIPERNQQVSRMCEIYTAASSVVIWLGKGNESLEYLLQMINSIPEIIPDASKALELDSWQTWLDALQMVHPNAAEFCMRNFVDFLKLPYFSRVWVVQEVAYASEAYVIYGETRAHYMRFYNFIDQMLKRTIGAMSLFYGTNSSSSLTADPGRISLGPEPGVALDENYFSLQSWLKDCGRRFCQDPRDRIYGFHGCFPEAIRSRITIDYAKSVPSLFSETTRAIIEVSGNLEILDAIDDFGSADAVLHGLPSWSPNYAMPASSTAWKQLAPGSQSELPPPFFRFSADGQGLHVHSSRLGSIKNIWRRSDLVIPRGFYPCKSPFDKLQLDLDQCSEALQVRQEHILRLLIDHSEGHVDDELHGRLAAATDAFTGKVIVGTFPAISNDYISRQWADRAIFTLDVPQRVTSPYDLMLVRLFNLPLGFAKETTRVNDTLFLIHGCQRYIVLRQQSSSHQVVCAGGLWGHDSIPVGSLYERIVLR